MALASASGGFSWQSKLCGDHGAASQAELWLELMFTLTPIWLAVLAGLLLGWTWRPKWVTFLVLALRSRPRLIWSVPPGLGARRLWLAATAAAAAPAVKDTWNMIVEKILELRRQWTQMHAQVHSLSSDMASFFPAGRLTARASRVLLDTSADVREGGAPKGCLTYGQQRGASLGDDEVKASSQSCSGPHTPDAVPLAGEAAARPPSPAAAGATEAAPPEPVTETRDSAILETRDGDENAIPAPQVRLPRLCMGPRGQGHRVLKAQMLTEEDLEELCSKVEDAEGEDDSWSLLMEKSAPRMKYTAWRRDPKDGPTEYRSTTRVEECSPEMMRDFFWDDDFRPAWDGMLSQWRTIEECTQTGFQVVQWVRKFPFFCKDREYVIGRRIWSHNNTYYCVTKGVPHPEVPRKNQPRRVDLFYSSWRIRAVEGGACEVVLFHQEDMGIQRDIAKMGVRQGMWPAVRKIEPGVRQYMAQRTKSPSYMSRSASMASVHTPVLIAPSPAPSPSASPSSFGGGSRKMRMCISLCDLHSSREALRMGTGVDGDSGSEEGAEWGSHRGSVYSAEYADGAGCPELEGGSPTASESSSRCAEGCSLPSTEAAEEASRAGVGAAAGYGFATNSPMKCVRKQRRGCRWALLASVVAVVCGLETGVVLKVAILGAVRHALASARGRREPQLLR